jgi:hypothetical protein
MSAINRAYLRNLARLYADGRPGGADGFVVDSDATANAVSFDTLVNGAAAELYDLLVSARGHEYYTTETTTGLTAGAIVAGTSAYTLPTDFYQLLSLRLEWSANELEEMAPTSVMGRTAYQNFARTWAYGTPKAYRLRGTQTASAQTLDIFPTPTSAVTARLRYIPAFALLSSDSATFDGVNGWEKLIALKAAIEYRTIAEKPLGTLPQLYQECFGRIQSLADQRNANFAEQVQNVHPEGRHRRVGGLGSGDGIFDGSFDGSFS